VDQVDPKRLMFGLDVMRANSIFMKISPLAIAAFVILVVSSKLGEAGDPEVPNVTMSAAPGAVDDEPVTRNQKVYGGHDANRGIPFPGSRDIFRRNQRQGI
jgi:hypothetical protein